MPFRGHRNGACPTAFISNAMDLGENKVVIYGHRWHKPHPYFFVKLGNIVHRRFSCMHKPMHSYVVLSRIERYERGRGGSEKEEEIATLFNLWITTLSSKFTPAYSHRVPYLRDMSKRIPPRRFLFAGVLLPRNDKKRQFGGA